MKNLLPNATDDFRRLNPHLFISGNVQGNVARPRGIRKRGMNKLERDFSLILAAQLVKGEISGWMYEGVKLKIGEGCYYCPDFMVIYPKVITKFYSEPAIKFVEVKGFLRDDARVKFLAAQEQHKWATFEMFRKDKKMGWTQIL